MGNEYEKKRTGPIDNLLYPDTISRLKKDENDDASEESLAALTFNGQGVKYGIADDGRFYITIEGGTEAINNDVIVLIENKTCTGWIVLKAPDTTMNGRDVMDCKIFINKALGGKTQEGL